MKGISLFSGAGIGETYLSALGINIVVANEVIEKRANLYRSINPCCDMVCGDITDEAIFEKIISLSHGIEFIIASPPCQGMSIAGKNRNQIDMASDVRNHLIYYVFKAITVLKPKYVLIENVPAMLSLKLMHKEKFMTVVEILNDKFGNEYNVESKIVDSADCGVPQTRLRAIIKLYPKDEKWPWPMPVSHKVTVREAIGDLPSLESGESSDIKWHFARKHSLSHVICMRHTATGKSAFSNVKYFPKKKDGSRVKGYSSSYRRIKWDEPAPTITIRNDAISSQRNVHPGRLQMDGTYSDARVLTPYELMVLSSLPKNWPIPDDTPEILVRQVIGEGIPPLMIKRIVGELKCLKR